MENNSQASNNGSTNPITPNEEYKFGHGDIRDFKSIKHLGEGAYGVVYKGVNDKTGEVIALKKIKLET